MIKKVSISVLKKDFYKLLKELENNEGLDLIVTKNNLPIAVVMSWKRYRALRETLALGTPDLDASSKKAKEDIKQGQWLTHEEMKKKFSLPLTEKEKETLNEFSKSAKYRLRQRLQRMPKT